MSKPPARGGSTTTYDIANRKIAVMDPLLHVMTSAYDAANRLIASVDPLVHITTTAYDRANRVIAVADPNAHVTTTVYDAASRLIATIDPLTHVTTTAYDRANRPVTVTDAMTFVTSTVYDAAGRLIERIDAAKHRRRRSGSGDSTPPKPADAGPVPNPAGTAAENALPTNKSQLGHIFRDAEGHLPNTLENQQLLQSVANDPNSTFGTDQYGTTWSGRTLPDGTQVWTQTRNGVITNGGLNQTPQVFNPQTGLSAPVKPGG